MTDQFNKLADALESYTGDGHGYQVDDAVLREAAALLRAAAGVDVAGLMALAQDFGSARWAEGFDEKNKPHGQPARHKKEAVKQLTALESALRLLLAQRVPPGCVVVPVERLTVEEIKTLRQQVRNDPRCQDEHWFVLMARAIEDRYLAAALTDQSQKKESP